MDIGVISVRYARALLKSATLESIESKVYQDVSILLDNYTNVSDLKLTIDNPMLTKSVKQKLLETACGKDITILTKKFIQLVLNEDRENILQFIAVSYITLYRKQNNITRGILTTATAVTPQTEHKMQMMVEAKTKGTVEFQAKVNPDIIGGFILEYDTYRMDASIKTKLKDILTQLKK